MTKLNWALVICWSLLLGHWSLAAAVDVTQISASHDHTLDTIEFTTSGFTKAAGLLLDNQLQLDFPAAAISAEVSVILEKNSARIASFAVQQVGGTARVIVYLKKDVDYEIINIFGRDRTVVELYDYVDYTARLMAAWEAANLKRAGEKFQPFKYEPAAIGPLRGKTIVVDPGHGGSDPGAFCANGIAEKNLTLQTAKRVAEKLSALGATIYLTRNADRRHSLRDIVNFANGLPADLFICLHFNATGNKEIAGTETYYYNDNSRRLARVTHTALIGELRQPDRGMRRMMFYTVHHTRMPAVLIEPLYLSNEREAELAVSPLFQEKLARTIAKGVNHYFGN